MNRQIESLFTFFNQIFCKFSVLSPKESSSSIKNIFLFSRNKNHTAILFEYFPYFSYVFLRILKHFFPLLFLKQKKKKRMIYRIKITTVPILAVRNIICFSRNKFCSFDKNLTNRFESFIRWFQMESPSKFELTKTEVQIADETELGEVKVMPLTSNVATSTPVQPGGIPCKNGGCKSWASRAESRMESPWHFLKTIFLISVIVALILWVIVYTFLVQYQILWRIRRAACNCSNASRMRRETWMIYALPFRRERACYTRLERTQHG